jgi:uncharacterized membrane protein YccF (DUF307 family)
MSDQTVQTIRRSPGCLISGLWFIFFGWEIGGLAVLAAWLLGITIVGLPVSLYILNHIPFIMLLQPPSSQVVAITSGGITNVQERPVKQINWLLRALYFIMIGFWWSLVWMILAYVMCLTIIGFPLGLWMFRMAPAMTTLKRY